MEGNEKRVARRKKWPAVEVVPTARAVAGKEN
jgi:hypothetical protein